MSDPVAPQKSQPAPEGPPTLSVVTTCPHCGGQNPWHLGQELTKCSYCDSLLWWPRAEGELPFLVAGDRAETDEGLIDVLVTYDALRVLSSLASQLPQTKEQAANPPLSPLDDPRLPALRDIKEKRRPLIRPIERHRLFVPYQLLSLTLAFYALGRTRPQGRKAFRPLFFLEEEVLPAYGAAWNFRDQGLQLGTRELKPLTEELLRSADFLAPADVTKDVELLIRRYIGNRQLLEPDLDVISFQGQVVSDRRWWLYRPYHFVLAETPEGTRWLLLDGQFGTIAGYPQPAEVEQLRARRWTRLDEAKAAGAHIHALASRCPECAWEMPEAPTGIYPLCQNCGHLLEPTPEGLRTIPYRTSQAHIPPPPGADSPPVAWLPFWALRCSWELQGRSAGLAEVTGALVPTLGALRAAIPEGMDTIYVPAYPSWTYEGHDAWGFAAGSSFSLQRPPVSEDRLVLEGVLDKEDKVVIPTVAEEQAARLFPAVLPSFFPVALQAGLNPLVLKALSGAKSKLEDARIVFFPVPITQDHGRLDLYGPGGTCPLGPLLDGRWPYGFQRTVRRRMAEVREMAR